MTESVDVGALKATFAKAGCPGIIKLIDWLQSDAGRDLKYMAIWFDPFGVTKLPFSAERARLLKRIQIGSMAQGPLGWLSGLSRELHKVPMKALKMFDAGCGEYPDAYEKAEEVSEEELADLLNAPFSEEELKALGPELALFAEIVQKRNVH